MGQVVAYLIYSIAQLLWPFLIQPCDLFGVPESLSMVGCLRTFVAGSDYELNQFALIQYIVQYVRPVSHPRMFAGILCIDQLAETFPGLRIRFQGHDYPPAGVARTCRGFFTQNDSADGAVHAVGTHENAALVGGTFSETERDEPTVAAGPLDAGKLLGGVHALLRDVAEQLAQKGVTVDDTCQTLALRI